MYATLMDALRKTGPVPPLVTVITDSITVHKIWLNQPSEVYCVADEDTMRVVESCGIAAEKIRITGFPVSLQFTEPLPAAADPGAQRILYLPSTTARRVGATLNALRPILEQGVKLTIPTGKHGSRLYHVLRKFSDSAKNLSIEIMGWTDRIPELLRTHDVVICKAGGAILHEVLAARIPAVIDYVVPGQEEGNAELLLSKGAAIRTNRARKTAEAVRLILADDGRLGREMRERMQPLSVPDAALLTAHEVLAAAANP